MITELTQEQLDYIPIHVQKYIDEWSEYIELTQDEANKTAKALYELMGKHVPDNIIIAQSPLDAYNKLVEIGISSPTLGEVLFDLESIHGQMRSFIYEFLYRPMSRLLKKYVHRVPWYVVLFDVRQYIAARISSRGLFPRFLQGQSSYMDGFNVSYFAWIDYYIYFGIEFDEDVLKKYELYRTANKHGLVYPLEDVCIVCSRPKEVHWK